MKLYAIVVITSFLLFCDFSIARVFGKRKRNFDIFNKMFVYILLTFPKHTLNLYSLCYSYIIHSVNYS